MDPIPAWIRIRVIPIPALLDVIPAPDPDPQKSGIVTPLVHTAKAAKLSRDKVWREWRRHAHPL